MFTAEFFAVKYTFSQAACILGYLLVKACSCALSKKLRADSPVLYIRCYFYPAYTLESFCYLKEANGTVGDTQVGFAGLLAWVLYRWKLNGKFVVQRPVKRWIAADKCSQTVLT